MNRQFKLGDKVRITSDQGFFSMNIGRVGKIVETDSSSLPVKVVFDEHCDDMDSFDWGMFEGIELVEAVVNTAPVEFEVGDRVICVNHEELPDDFGKKGTVVEKSSFYGERAIRVRLDGGTVTKLHLCTSFNKIDEELVEEDSVIDNSEVTVENVAEKSESDRINLLTPAQIRVYNAAVRLSEAQKEFTDAINAHHAELQKGE